MAHIHPVVDSDARFVIDPDTRVISTASDKLELVQGDHQSERITFEIPRIVEGHDMSLCDRIKIHYINIDRKTKAQSKDIYIADDVSLDGEKVVFSWLISGNATRYYGRLNFIVLFECLDDDGNYTYKWNTEICKLLTVGEGISNTEAVTEDYSDILEKFRKEVIQEATADTVKFTEQELTDTQKLQARKNIGAQDALNGFTAYDCVFKPWIGNTDMHDTFYVKGEFHPVDYKNVSEDVATAWGGFQLTIIGGTRNPEGNKKNLKYVATLAKNGVFGDEYLTKYDYNNPIIIQTEPFEPVHTATIYFQSNPKALTLHTTWNNGYDVTMQYYMDDDSFLDRPTFLDSYIHPYSYDLDKEPALNQFKMHKDPTADMEVATKKYVDKSNRTITISSATDLTNFFKADSCQVGIIYHALDSVPFYGDYILENVPLTLMLTRETHQLDGNYLSREGVAFDSAGNMYMLTIRTLMAGQVTGVYLSKNYPDLMAPPDSPSYIRNVPFSTCVDYENGFTFILAPDDLETTVEVQIVDDWIPEQFIGIKDDEGNECVMRRTITKDIFYYGNLAQDYIFITFDKDSKSATLIRSFTTDISKRYTVGPARIEPIAPGLVSAGSWVVAPVDIFVEIPEVTAPCFHFLPSTLLAAINYVKTDSIDVLVRFFEDGPLVRLCNDRGNIRFENFEYKSLVYVMPNIDVAKVEEEYINGFPYSINANVNVTVPQIAECLHSADEAKTSLWKLAQTQRLIILESTKSDLDNITMDVACPALCQIKSSGYGGYVIYVTDANFEQSRWFLKENNIDPFLQLERKFHLDFFNITGESMRMTNNPFEDEGGLYDPTFENWNDYFRQITGTLSFKIGNDYYYDVPGNPGTAKFTYQCGDYTVTLNLMSRVTFSIEPSTTFCLVRRNTLPQVRMIDQPTDSMHIATKQYVDSQKFSGSYNDLTDKPSPGIPMQNTSNNAQGNFVIVADVDSDGHATKIMDSGVSADFINWSDQLNSHYLTNRIYAIDENGIESKLVTESVIASGPIINSSTPNSTKRFKITVDDSGTISATEVTN